MNYMISIIDPHGASIYEKICEELSIPLSMEMMARGTATQSMLDLLGIESREKRAFLVVADPEKTKALIRACRERLYIDAPGNGILFSIPVKSVGGGRTLQYLKGTDMKKSVPELHCEFELILCIANEGHTDDVMDAARAGGAAGGTVLHAKGTGAAGAEKFLSVSLATEKEIVLILASAETKAAIMRSILEHAGPGTPTGALVLSLPVTEVAGFGLKKEKA